MPTISAAARRPRPHRLPSRRLHWRARRTRNRRRTFGAAAPGPSRRPRCHRPICRSVCRQRAGLGTGISTLAAGGGSAVRKATTGRGCRVPSYGSQSPLAAAQPMTSPPFGSPTVPSPAAGAAPQLPTINPPLGLDGYCPVSLSERQQWVLGDRRWARSTANGPICLRGPKSSGGSLPIPIATHRLLRGTTSSWRPNKARPCPACVSTASTFGNHVYLFSSEATLERFAKNPNVYVNQALGSLRAGAYGGQQMR